MAKPNPNYKPNAYKTKYNKGHVGDVLAEFFKRGGMKRAVKRAEVVLLWPQVAGSDLAKFTEAKTLQDGVLYVEVTDSETSMHLTLQRQRFLDVYQVKFGVKDIREIRFRVGRPKLQEQDLPKAKSVSIDPQLLARYAKTLGTLPEGLSQGAMQVAKSMMIQREVKLAEGFVPCLICEVLTKRKNAQGEVWCETCERYANDVKVKRSSQTLAVDPHAPTIILSEDERAVAVHLAKAYLLEKLNELLPHVLATPILKNELASIARCYVAHALNKSINTVTDEDLDILDSRVARALGRWK